MEDDRNLVPARDQSQAADLVRLAIDKDLSAESLEKIVALHERIADRLAAQEFADALAEFQSLCPLIPRNTVANITTRGGARFSYNFADLDTIVSTVREPLRRNGLSFSWDSKTEGGSITCVCTLRHVNGHKESASFSCPTETPAGMTEQQKVAAALTFARRQALVQVLGITTTEPDADGGNTVDTLTDTELSDLEALIDEVKPNMPKFLEFMHVESLDQIRRGDLRRAVNALNQKRRHSR